MNEIAAFADYQVLTLDRVKYHATQYLSPYALDRMSTEVVFDDICHRLVLHLKTEGLEDSRRRKVVKKTIVERPIYESWRHHLVASLPLGSFRRRFCAFLWNIDPEYQGTQKVHEVVATQRAVFNDAEFVYPDSLGPIRFPMSVDYYRTS